MTTIELEERLLRLEAEVTQLKKQLATEKPQTVVPWWEQRFGAFADSPEYEEATRRGREYRESLRPKNEITLANHATLLTRNLSDFGKVPNLRAEDGLFDADPPNP